MDKETNKQRVKEMKRKRKIDARALRDGANDNDKDDADTGVVIGYPESESDSSGSD